MLGYEVVQAAVVTEDGEVIKLFKGKEFDRGMSYWYGWCNENSYRVIKRTENFRNNNTANLWLTVVKRSRRS